MSDPVANRATRRAFDKAAACLSRRSRIPAGVRQALTIQVPGAIDSLAARRGMRITPGGCVRPGLRSAGPATDPAPTGTRATPDPGVR